MADREDQERKSPDYDINEKEMEVLREIIAEGEKNDVEGLSDEADIYSILEQETKYSKDKDFNLEFSAEKESIPSSVETKSEDEKKEGNSE